MLVIKYKTIDFENENLTLKITTFITFKIFL